ncbi:MAG: S-layer homology domain-containing protein, partial [Thermotogaceae bacterium]|nr:S-layer homology domain-containing protein [Thermotogaceae bacterium]
MLLRNKFVLIATLLICALSFAGLKDIAASPYSAAIEKLFAAGIVEAENDLFNPTEVLSRADAAEWIVKTFKLSTIQSMKLEEEVEKKFVYTDPLGVIDEAFVVPSAKDIVDIEGEEYIEGLIKVRAEEVIDGLYRPFEAVTGAEFALAVAKVLFGVDEPIDYSAKLSQLVYVPAELLSMERPLRREEAAQILSNFVDNP